MRKYIPLLFLLCSLLLVSCGQKESPPSEDPLSTLLPDCAEETLPPTEPPSHPVTEAALTGGPFPETDRSPENDPTLYPHQLVRTGWTEDGTDIEVIGSEEKLKSILEGKRSGSFDGMLSLADACSKYDKTFFETHLLLFCYYPESSGSIRHELLGVLPDGRILVKRNVPEVFTCDMAGWYLLLELPSDSPIPSRSPEILLTDDGRYYPVRGQEPRKVECRTELGSLSLVLPYEYDYSLLTPSETDDDLMRFGITFFPKDDPSCLFTFVGDPSFAGICGTGLTHETLSLGENTVSRSITQSALEKTNTKPVEGWYFFTEAPGNYFAAFSVSAVQWKKYQKGLEKILSSDKAGEDGMLSRSEIMIYAEKAAYYAGRQIDYDEISLHYSMTEGHWEATYRKDGSPVFSLLLSAFFGDPIVSPTPKAEKN